MTKNSRIAERRKELGMTLEEVAQIVGVGKSTVRKLEIGLIANMKRDKIALLAKALRVDPDFILGIAPEAKAPLNTCVAVPIYNDLHHHNLDNAKAIATLEVTSSFAFGGDYFAYVIQGRSMSPRMQKGDIILCDRKSKPTSGNVVLVYLGGSDTVMARQLNIEAGGVALVPLNPSFEVMRFTDKEVEELPVRIMGVAKELRALLN